MCPILKQLLPILTHFQRCFGFLHLSASIKFSFREMNRSFVLFQNRNRKWKGRCSTTTSWIINQHHELVTNLHKSSLPSLGKRVFYEVESMNTVVIATSKQLSIKHPIEARRLIESEIFDARGKRGVNITVLLLITWNVVLTWRSIMRPLVQNVICVSKKLNFFKV